ncbi:MAG: phosphatase PAP2 family protein [Candidatus Melainabacteria bacterium]|nr:phosphatase PAP2 family protein [Candidatus Melainabacteria bacterium]
MGFLLHPIASLNHLVARLVTDKITLLLAIIFFAYLSLTYKGSLWEDIDKKISGWAKEAKGNFLRSSSEHFALFGNAVFHILFCVLLSIIYFIFVKEPIAGISILFVLIFSWGFNRMVKLIYKRERPRHIVSNVRKRLSYCFPSGHVMASIPIYFFTAVLLQGKLTFLPWYLIAFVITFFVISSRIYLNHHYFTDVLGGIALGIFCLSISMWFYFFISYVGLA